MMNKTNKIFLSIIILEIIIFSGMIFCPKLFPLTVSSKFNFHPTYQVVFNFNQPVIKSSFEQNFKIEPEVSGNFIWQNFNRQVIFQPAYLQYQTPYTASIQNVRSFFLASAEKKSVDFELIPPSSFTLSSLTPQGLPSSESFFVKPDGEKIALSPPQISQGKYLDVDISDQVMAVYQNAKIQNIYEVSTGQPGMSTPLGKFKITKKEINHWSATYGLYMPFALKFLPGYYIHELPYWPNGYREGTSHLGTRVSHGCIRLGIGPAKAVFDFAEVGTALVIHE
jgi:lipoprotein-anchoring transpeptidase ErfK/SrfK